VVTVMEMVAFIATGGVEKECIPLLYVMNVGVLVQSYARKENYNVRNRPRRDR
jgi:hypothetical protein